MTPKDVIEREAGFVAVDPLSPTVRGAGHYALFGFRAGDRESSELICVRQTDEDLADPLTSYEEEASYLNGAFILKTVLVKPFPRGHEQSYASWIAAMAKETTRLVGDLKPAVSSE